VLHECAVADGTWCLEHACGRCGWVNVQPIYIHSTADIACARTKQHDPKARQSCYGIHTEPCPRYHQIMFFLGMSHSCYPCSLSNEQHEKRHVAVRNPRFITRDVGPRANGSLRVTGLVSEYKKIRGCRKTSCDTDQTRP
jgi:hypothetical protein